MQQATYYTDMLPRETNLMEMSYELSNRLNSKGLKPKKRDTYSVQIVHNILYNRGQDDNVTAELIQYILEFYEGEAMKKRLNDMKRELKDHKRELSRLAVTAD